MDKIKIELDENEITTILTLRRILWEIQLYQPQKNEAYIIQKENEILNKYLKVAIKLENKIKKRKIFKEYIHDNRWETGLLNDAIFAKFRIINYQSYIKNFVKDPKERFMSLYNLIPRWK